MLLSNKPVQVLFLGLSYSYMHSNTVTICHIFDFMVCLWHTHENVSLFMYDRIILNFDVGSPPQAIPYMNILTFIFCQRIPVHTKTVYTPTCTLNTGIL